MTTNDKILLDLNFNFWASKNIVYGSAPLNPSVRAMQTIQHKQNILMEFQPVSFLDIVNEISSSIEIVKLDFDKATIKSFTYIFDLIHLWGGKTGRGPYVFKNNDGYTTREKFETIYGKIYRETIRNALNQDREFIDTNFTSIPRVGISFATKHLRFWCNYPVHDLRLNLLLFGTSKMQSYEHYISKMKNFAKKNGISVLEVEKALFAFSNNYFPNGKLKIKNSFLFNEDIDIAKTLSRKFDYA